MSAIPDPTIDLDWSGYVGSIQEHFRAQAEAHPERTCVVETKSSKTAERSFTYRQIYEASNTLAWHLHKAGVTNGDVVMIWAHRSVDLVVALMGILVRWRFCLNHCLASILTLRLAVFGCHHDRS